MKDASKLVNALFGGWGPEQRAALTKALDEARQKSIGERRDELAEQLKELEARKAGKR
jgi:TRAP-type C4-dicarboxylate transport system substrate-binding protein